MDRMEIGQEEKSRKKLLVPLVVLLLCAVSLTGAAYAYNSTVTNVENNVHVEGLTLNLTDENGVVDSAIYNVNFAYGPHNTQAKAVKYVVSGTSYGFTTKHVSENYNPNDSNTTKWDTTKTDLIKENLGGYYEIGDFETGYYVETLFYDGNVENASYVTAAGYNDTIAIADAQKGLQASDIKAAADAGNKGVFKLDAYTLNVVNQSGKAVKVSYKAAFDETPVYGEGVKAIYLVVTGDISNGENADPTHVEKIINLKDALNGDICDFTADQNASTNLTVTAYVHCTDFYGIDMPTVLNADYDFVLQFTAATN